MPQPNRKPRDRGTSLGEDRSKSDATPRIQISGNTIGPVGSHTYAIGGNTIPVFVLGNVGADDFFLLGAEPEPETEGYPLISANLFDRDGRQLCRIVRNRVEFGVEGLSKTYGDGLGYEILDRLGHLIMKVTTEYVGGIGKPDGHWRTVIEGNFYDRDGRLAVRAMPNGLGGIETDDLPMFLPGLHDTFSGDRRPLVQVALESRGLITRMRKGEQIDNEHILLDGLLLMDCVLTNCLITVRSGQYRIGLPLSVSHCTWEFGDTALAVKNLAFRLAEEQLSPSAAVELRELGRKMAGE